MWAWSYSLRSLYNAGFNTVKGLAVDPQGERLVCIGGSGTLDYTDRIFILILETSTGEAQSGLIVIKLSDVAYAVKSSGLILRDDNKVYWAGNSAANIVPNGYE